MSSEITPETYASSPLTGDWRSRIRTDLDALADAWAEPAAWDGMTRIATMDVPADQAAIVAAEEVLVHSWDLARATGQPFEADPDLVAAAQRMLEQFASPDAPSGDTVPFGPSQPLAADASPLD